MIIALNKQRMHAHSHKKEKRYGRNGTRIYDIIGDALAGMNIVQLPSK